jgi:hypothetical protein
VQTTELQQPKSLWIEKESPNLAWYRTHTENEKEKHYGFFEDLSRHVVPFNQGIQQPQKAGGSAQQYANRPGTGQQARKQYRQ